MTVVLLVVAALLVSHGCGQKAPGDKNDEWRKADLIVTQITNFYRNLAIYTEDNKNEQKRFYSVVSLAMYFYAKSDSTDDTRRINNAVNETREQLNRTSDAIAAPMRSLLVYLNSLVQQPITDIKLSCTPETIQIDCDRTLKHMCERNERRCSGYSKNVELYNVLTEEQDAGPRKRFLNDLRSSSNGNDRAALSWFQNAASTKHKEIFKYLKRLYKKLLHETYPCIYPLILI